IFSNLPVKNNCERYKNYVLRLNNYKYCRDCVNLLVLNNFSTSKYTIHEKNNQCKQCAKEYRDEHKESAKEYSKKYREENKEEIKLKSKEYNQKDYVKLLNRKNSAKRKAAKLQRTPSWGNEQKIKEIYLNCPSNHHVDHIIPLQGKYVSGLHVHTNLQYLTAKDNLSKGNRYIIN
ncbi:unnamed protein product, partial [marine sediment metagenome]